MKVIAVSHGDFAKGIVNSVQMLVGEQDDLLAFGLYPHEEPKALADKIRQVLDQSKGEEILVVSDLFHGTPFNVCVDLSEHYKFHHITGINLPLLIEVMMDRMVGKTPKEICEHIMQDAGSTVKDVNAMLEDDEDEEDQQ